MKIEEVILYWEGLRKTFSENMEKENNPFGKRHYQTSIEAMDAALTALRSMPETTKPGWISVKERLPNFGIPVLICWDGYTDIAEYLCGMVCPKWRTQHYGTIDLTSVTHWMPLPEPPEEG